MYRQPNGWGQIIFGGQVPGTHESTCLWSIVLLDATFSERPGEPPRTLLDLVWDGRPGRVSSLQARIMAVL